jgi:hypothetical protein
MTNKNSGVTANNQKGFLSAYKPLLIAFAIIEAIALFAFIYYKFL